MLHNRCYSFNKTVSIHILPRLDFIKNTFYYISVDTQTNSFDLHTEKKRSHSFLLILLSCLVLMLVFALVIGYSYYSSIIASIYSSQTISNQKNSTQDLQTTAAYQNPFAAPTDSYQNPFASADQSQITGSPYQNPFQSGN